MKMHEDAKGGRMGLPLGGETMGYARVSDVQSRGDVYQAFSELQMDSGRYMN